MTIHVDGLRLRRELGRAEWGPAQPWMESGWMLRQNYGDGIVIVTAADYGDGGNAWSDWIHASMSRRDHVPSYEDMRKLHAGAFGDGWAYLPFAPPAEHVNIHDNVLHLFGRADGQRVFPDFTLGTGSI